jgi:hypothetical protein
MHCVFSPSSASKKATAKKKVLSDDDDDDFVPLKTPAAKKPAAKKLNSGKKPRAAAEPSEYEVVNGLDGQPLHSDAYMNNAPRRGTSGMPGVSSFKAKDGTEFYFPNFRSDTQVMVQLKTLKEPKTPEGLVNCAYKLDDWYDQKFADTNNKYWLDKKNFCIDESGQKVRPMPIRVPSRPLCPKTLLHRFGSYSREHRQTTSASLTAKPTKTSSIISWGNIIPARRRSKLQSHTTGWCWPAAERTIT